MIRRYLLGSGSRRFGPLAISWAGYALPLPYLKIVYGEVETDYLGVWFGITAPYSDSALAVEIGGIHHVDPESRRGRIIAWLAEKTDSRL